MLLSRFVTVLTYRPSADPPFLFTQVVLTRPKKKNQAQGYFFR